MTGQREAAAEPWARLRHLRGLLIDLDGVVYRGDHPLPGVPEAFVRLQQSRFPFVLITNNSTLSVDAFQAKLERMGIHVDSGQILTSAEATADFLARLAPTGGRVFIIGEQGLRSAVLARGFEASAQRPDFVVVGMDRQFDYAKLALALRAIRAGARLIGANPDATLPTEAGELPGAGALLAAISAASGAQPTIVGKPAPALFELAARRLALPPQAVGVVGDRLDTDILGARHAGMFSVLVLTGITSTSALKEAQVRPDLVMRSLAELIDRLLGCVGASPGDG